MNRFFNIVEKWDYIGQGVFFLLIFCGTSAFLLETMKQIVILVHGYPPVESRVKDNVEN